MSEETPATRVIDLRIRTIGGHEYVLPLPEDRPELRQLFTAFVNRAAMASQGKPNLVELPLEGGEAACTIAVDQIVSIESSPPVLLQLEQPVEAAAAQPAAQQPVEHAPAPTLRRPEVVVIDDFLGVDENTDMVAYALRERDRFEPGTVEGKAHPARHNSVVMNFTHSAHSNLLVNRLLIWFPTVARALGHEAFPLKAIESQLTASNDGDFYGAHMDTDGSKPDDRVIACVYYFFREPRGFSGGDLRVYDTLDYGGEIRRAESFQSIQPVNNRLVAFTARTFHELRPIRCPSKAFEDSRFAMTNWIHRADNPDPAARFGWGHFHAGTIPRAFQGWSSLR